MARLHTLYIINSRSCIIVTKQMQSDWKIKRFQHQNADQTADEYYHLHVYLLAQKHFEGIGRPSSFRKVI